MALSRSMKNLMHQSAIARAGGGNPGGGGRQGFIGRAMQQARGGGQYNPGPKLQPRGPGGGPEGGPGGGVMGRRGGLASRVSQAMKKAKGGGMLGQIGRNPRTGGPGLPPRVGSKPPRGQVQIGVPGGRMPRPGGPGTVAGKPRPGAGTFGFASQGGGGTPALQEATAGARSQVMRQAAARPTGLPGAMSGAQQQAAMQRSRAAGPAALAQPRGQTTAQRIGGQQGPPARRGGMARALGSGGSRRRMLR